MCTVQLLRLDCPITVKPVYSGPVYYGHRTTSQSFQLALYFLQSLPILYSGCPVYNGRLAISWVTVAHRFDSGFDCSAENRTANQI